MPGWLLLVLLLLWRLKRLLLVLPLGGGMQPKIAFQWDQRLQYIGRR
jgi:hypothetical protein